VPILPDNATLRMFIDAIETDGVNTAAHVFISNYFQRPEFQVLIESETLREAMKEAINADLAVRRETVDASFLKLLFPATRRKLNKLVAIRDEKFENYEMLRRLIALDNKAITLTKTRWAKK
jgi:hypothetical protein